MKIYKVQTTQWTRIAFSLSFGSFISFSSLSFSNCNSIPATWTGAGDGTNWANTGNWTPVSGPACFPNGLTDVATFNVTGAGHPTITQNAGAIQLSQITFADTNFTINGPAANTITFQNTPSFLAILPSSSSIGAIIAAPVVIDSRSASINLNAGAGHTGILAFNAAVTINDGLFPGATLTNTNQGNSNSVMFNGATLTINQGVLNNSNTFAYTNATGSLMTITAPIITLNTGSAINNTNASTGTITGISNAVGSNLVLVNPFTIDGGDTLNQNDAAIVNGGIGVLLQPSGGLTLSEGSLMNINTGPITGTSTNHSIGSLIVVGSFLNITGGQLTNQNTGTVDAFSFGSLIQSSGATTVSGNGVLLNNDTFQTNGIITVSSAGVLSGTGIYTGINAAPSGMNPTTVINEGLVKPFNGTSPGTLTINGTYTQTDAGTLISDLESASQFSELNVTGPGTASLDGTLAVVFLPDNNVMPGETYTLVQAVSRSGKFASIDYFDLPPSLVPELQYTPNSVLLFFIPTISGPEAVGYAGGYLNAVLSDINHINSLLGRRCEELRRHFASSSVTKAGRLDLSEWFPPARLQSVDENLIAVLESSIFPDSAQRYFITVNPQTEEKQEQLRREVSKSSKTDRPWNFYFGPTGRAGGDLHTRKDQPGLNYWSAGALTGFDYAFSHVGVGFIADYERITAHAKQKWGKITVDELHASLYSTFVPAGLPELAVNGIVGGAYEWYTIRRNTGTPADKLVAKGTPHGSAFDALFGVEYALANRQIQRMPTGLEIIPMASVQYIHLRAQGYEEHGGDAFDFHVQSQKIKSLRSGLGLRVNYTWQRENFSFVPEVYGEWQREFLNKRRQMRFIPVDFEVDSTTLDYAR